MKRPRLPEIEWDTETVVLSAVMLSIYLLLIVVGEWPWEDAATPMPTARIAIVTPTSVVQPSAQSLVDLTTAELDTYWRAQFAQAGIAQIYMPPSLAVFYPEHPPHTAACDVSDQDPIPPAYYCQDIQTIYLSAKVTQQTDAGQIATTVIRQYLAHEWGHHIRALTDPQMGYRSAAELQPIELQAICAEGLWSSYALDQGTIERSEIFSYRTDLATGTTHHDTHGTGPQRRQAFDDGFAAGDPEDCGYVLGD